MPSTEVSPPIDAQSDFQYAWNDLNQRIARALTLLRETQIRRETDSTLHLDGGTRLAGKIEAVERGLGMWTALNAAAEATGDYAAAWRTFTDEATAARREATEQEGVLGLGYRQGLGLMLDYQRGYGPHVDAPAPLR